MTKAEITAALARLEKFFAGRRSRQAILAREALERPDAGDAELRESLRAELAAGLKPDGSVGSSVVPTIWRAIELMDLGLPGEEPGTAKVVTWVMGLAGKPGAFGEGCNPARHANHACEHYLAGFFSPGAPTERIAPITIPCGKTFRAEPAARFAVSCLALHAVVRAGLESRASVRKHLASLTLLTEGWTDWSGYWAPDLVIATLQPLAIAPQTYRPAALAAAQFIADNQNDDGTWPNADLFHALESLLAVNSPAAQKALARAAPVLIAQQRKDGAFGPTAQEERALIGVRALLLA